MLAVRNVQTAVRLLYLFKSDSLSKLLLTVLLALLVMYLFLCGDFTGAPTHSQRLRSGICQTTGQQLNKDLPTHLETNLESSPSGASLGAP